MTDVQGFVAPGFERVGDVMATGADLVVGTRERHVDLGSGGGAFAAYVHGEPVVDIWTGLCADDVPWAENTRAAIMSATKGLTALCAQILSDQGRLDVDARVVEYWPEFGAAGKEATLVRHVLSHQSGAIGVPGADRLLSWDGTGWDDVVAIAQAIASAPPAWPPGTTHGYHGLTYGWLVGELVRRVAGASLGTFFRENVAEPLDVECDIGTPPEALSKVARVTEWTPSASGRRDARQLDPESLAGRSVLAGPDGHLFVDGDGMPRFASFMNTPAVLAAEIGAIGATATARGLARIYAVLADGDRLVSPGTVKSFAVEQVCGKDAVIRTPTRWAVGYTREPPPLLPGLPRQHGPNDEAFGHPGAGGQIGFADPVAGVGCAFVRNHLEHQASGLMGASLAAALYECFEG